MDFLNDIKARIPDYAKDVRLNLDSVVARSSLAPHEAVGAALAAAFAARSEPLVSAIRANGQLTETQVNAALTAASLMGMTNVYYSYTPNTGDEEVIKLPAQIRMNAYATHGGVSEREFELWALAASAVGKCKSCIRSHTESLKKLGVSATEIRDVGRIAAVVNATAQVLSVEQAAVAA